MVAMHYAAVQAISREHYPERSLEAWSPVPDERRCTPFEYGYNLACIEGIDLSSITTIAASAGASHSLINP